MKIKKIIKCVKNLIKQNQINNSMKKDVKAGIIPVVVDSELDLLNQYLEPVLSEMNKLKGLKFNFYFAEHMPGFASSFSCYNPKNAFHISFYEHLKYPKLFLSPHIYPDGPKGAYRIFFDHAICSAKFSHHPENFYKNYDAIFVSGALYKKKITGILEKYNLKDKLKIVEIGYPKSDKLFSDEFPKKEDILTELGLNPKQTTILYAPSWEEGLSLREYGIDMLQKILKNDDFNLIVKMHPVSLTDKDDVNFDFYTGATKWLDELACLKTHKNCKIIDKYDIEPLLVASDIMITDLSSVALEFLIFEKPVIYLDCPKFEKTFKTLYVNYNDLTYKELLNDPLSNGGRHVGLVNYDYNKICQDITYLLENPDFKKQERREFSKLLLSNKGLSSKVAAREIVKLIEIN